jgi:hypothetical protein
MVYVTDVSAILDTRDGTHINVEYKMTDIERQVYEKISVMLGQYLNALLNGLVVFEIDTFFTTEQLGRQKFGFGMTSWGSYSYKIWGYNIPEIGGVEIPYTGGWSMYDVGGMLDEYRTVITTIGMNDFDGLLHGSAGSGWANYASIHLESLFTALRHQSRLNTFSSNGVVALPSSITTIGANAFDGATSIQELHISNSVTFVGSQVFAWWTNPQSIYIDYQNEAATYVVGWHSFWINGCNPNIIEWAQTKFIVEYEGNKPASATALVTGNTPSSTHLEDISSAL